jgi:hypothetical protein
VSEALRGACRSRRAAVRGAAAIALGIALGIAVFAPRVARADERVEPSSTRLEGSFVDLDGHVRPFRPTYDAWFGSSRRQPDYARAAAEAGGLVMLGLGYYWINPLANREDWDDPSIGDRFDLRSLRFDTNLNTTNHFLHPGAGALVYGLARVNGVSPPVAFAYTAAMSAVWEFGLEWHEKPSINDLLYTSIGGVSFGEVAVHIGDYLNSAPEGRGPLQEIAADLLGAPRRVLALLDGEAPPSVELPRDALGMSSAYAHDFRLVYDSAFLTNDRGRDGTLQRARLDARVVDMPGLLRPGSFSTWFSGGNFSELHLRLGWGDGGLDEVDLQTRATLFGHYGQTFSSSADGGMHGFATMAGVGTGLRFDATRYLGRHDQLSMLHLVIPHAEVWFAHDDLVAHLSADASPDFASIDSLAYLPYDAVHGDDGLKSVLQRQGYQYSFGVSARARGSIAIDPVELSAAASIGRYESIDGLDRLQERLTADVPGVDTVAELEASVTMRLGAGLAVGAGISEKRRTSRLDEIRVRAWDRDLHVSLGLVF